MKILHIGKFYPPFHGGMENYLCDLAVAQVQQGHQVTVWVHNHEWESLTSDTDEALIDGVQLIRQKCLKPLLFTPIMLGFGSRLKKIIGEQSPDLIHLHWPNPSLFKLLLYRSAGKIPWVISWHSDMVTSHSSQLMKLIYWFIKPLESLLVKRAKSLLVSSQAYANHSKQLSHFSNKTAVIPLGIASAEIEGLDLGKSSLIVQQAEKKWQINQLRLFHLGRLTFYKNQQFLIEALKNLSDTHLLIAGEGGLYEKLNDQIKQSKLSDHVQLLGGIDRSQVHGLFASCDIFCMASHDRAESFGVVLLEAIYHNRIILVPNTVGSGMGWLAENYNKGFVYESNNHKDFALKVNYIRSNMVEIMKKPKQFQYQINHIAETIEQHYKTILSGDEI